MPVSMSSTLLAAILAAGGFTPAHLGSGARPTLPVGPVGGGEVLLELSVGADGRVKGIVTLRSTEPFTEALSAAVSSWSFAPAREDGRAAPSRVLVAGLFRPPVLVGPTLGEVPKDVAQPSGEAPFPTNVVTPAYPPKAVGNGLAVVELEVGADGAVRRTRLVGSSGVFDGSAMDAASRWTFRPPPRGAAFVYVVFGFRQPVMPGTPTGPVPVPTPRVSP